MSEKWYVIRGECGAWLPHPGKSSATKLPLTRDLPPRLFISRKSANASLAHWLKGELENKPIYPVNPMDDMTWEQYRVDGTSREHMRPRMGVHKVEIKAAE